MSKLDELDKTKIAIFYEDFRKQLPQTLVKPSRFKRAEVKDGKYTEGSLEESYVLAEDDLYQAFVGAFLAILQEEREAVARTIGLSASTAGLSPKDLAKDDDWKEAVEKIKRSEREAIKKELDLKNQKPEDYSYANGNDMESFCRGYNACKEYVEWVIDGKPDLLNELNKN